MDLHARRTFSLHNSGRSGSRTARPCLRLEKSQWQTEYFSMRFSFLLELLSWATSLRTTNTPRQARLAVTAITFKRDSGHVVIRAQLLGLNWQWAAGVGSCSRCKGEGRRKREIKD